MIMYVNEIEITEIEIITLTFKSVPQKCLIKTTLMLLSILGHPKKVKSAGREEIFVFFMSEDCLRSNYMAAKKIRGQIFT